MSTGPRGATAPGLHGERPSRRPQPTTAASCPGLSMPRWGCGGRWPGRGGCGPLTRCGAPSAPTVQAGSALAWQLRPPAGAAESEPQLHTGRGERGHKVPERRAGPDPILSGRAGGPSSPQLRTPPSHTRDPGGSQRPGRAGPGTAAGCRWQLYPQLRLDPIHLSEDGRWGWGSDRRQFPPPPPPPGAGLSPGSPGDTPPTRPSPARC